MKPIIEVKGLSKKYRLGELQPYFTLRDTLADIFKNPLAAVKAQLPLEKDEFWALKDINFEVNQGEVVGIIGRNGSGKSTLLKILSQITPPTEGEAILRGRVGSLLEVGTGFSPELTGRENIYLNGAVLGMKKTEVKRKFDEIVAFSEVEKFLDTPLKHYSSGMYMRLAFSVAAHLEPEILIIDEVLAVGDSEFQKKCIGKMGEVAGEGRTVLFVSHNLLTVEALCSKCVLLDAGTERASGKTKEVLAVYNSQKSITPTAEYQKIADVATGDSIKFSAIRIANSHNKSEVQSEDSLFFELTYSSEYTGPILEARIVITVVSKKSDQVVLRIDSDVTSKSFNNSLAPSGTVKCKTDPIHLVEGRYGVNIDFIVGGTSKCYIGDAAELIVQTNLQAYDFKAYPDSTVCDRVLSYSFTQD